MKEKQLAEINMLIDQAISLMYTLRTAVRMGNLPEEQSDLFFTTDLIMRLDMRRSELTDVKETNRTDVQ